MCPLSRAHHKEVVNMSWVDYVSVVQGSPQGSSQHELGGLVWEDVEGQENFPVSAGFELTTHGLLVQEHNYSATTHSPSTTLKMPD